MKNFSPRLLASASLFFFVTSYLDAQEKALLKAFPELGKPIVQMQGLESTGASGNDIIVYALCSTTKPGAIELYVKRPAQMKSSDNIRLDVTVFKRGFESNRYALLYKASRTKAFDSKNLVQQEVRKSLDLSTMALTATDTSQNIAYKLEGLNPGMTYFWRILKEGKDAWESTEVIRIQAPTCPVDNFLGPK